MSIDRIWVKGMWKFYPLQGLVQNENAGLLVQSLLIIPIQQ